LQPGRVSHGHEHFIPDAHSALAAIERLGDFITVKLEALPGVQLSRRGQHLLAHAEVIGVVYREFAAVQRPTDKLD
jgi:hypothetical protein